VHEIKQPIIDGVNELIDELGSLIGNIAEQAPEHIHAREVILTLGRSRIVEAFLKRVAKTDRPFEVIVADTAPSYEGAEVARRLSEAGIQATLITDAAVFALMARINKVIIGTHAVMADGSLLAPAGTLAVALAAQHHSVPFVVCAGIPQLTPIFPTDADDLNLLLAPSPVLSYDETGDLDVDADVEGGAAQGGGFSADSPNPACDYVPPELISLFITNIGGTHASYIYRLLAEFYSPQDINLKALNPTQL
jgi:translation initiation factor eIF-2B subunit beta